VFACAFSASTPGVFDELYHETMPTEKISNEMVAYIKLLTGLRFSANKALFPLNKRSIQ
jgi:hypothetical protein